MPRLFRNSYLPGALVGRDKAAWLSRISLVEVYYIYCPKRQIARGSFSHRDDNDLPAMRIASVLEQENALPGPELHSGFRDRNYFTRWRQDRADVRRHVVWSLVVVLEIGRVFRHEPVEEFLEIAARGWIRIFHNDEAATGVLNENSQRAERNAAAGQGCVDLVRDFIGPLASSPDHNRFGVHAHGSHFSAR